MIWLPYYITNNAIESIIIQRREHFILNDLFEGKNMLQITVLALITVSHKLYNSTDLHKKFSVFMPRHIWARHCTHFITTCCSMHVLHTHKCAHMKKYTHFHCDNVIY